MTVQTVTDRTAWDTFLQEAQPPTFLQSWAWGETQRALGEEVLRLEVRAGERTLGVAQAVTVSARRGKFLHVPHGPVTAGSREVLRALLAALREETQRRKLAFLRVSPIQRDDLSHREFYAELGFRPAPIHLHAERLWVLDLTPAEEALLAAMRKTTRNLIRRAEREELSVSLSVTPDNLETFMRLYRETAARERFVPFSEETIRAEVDAFEGAGGSVVAVARHQQEPLAAAIAVFTPWSGFYHHGASARSNLNLPASYALQWALIREAKRRGCLTYNFWGVTDKRNHPWAGLSFFKQGFGGCAISLLAAQDLPLSVRYVPAFVIDRVRHWIRGY